MALAMACPLRAQEWACRRARGRASEVIMKIRTVLWWTLLMVLLVQAGAAIARGGRGTERMGGATVPTAFAKEAARGGMGEVQLGTLASDKAQDPDVKSFGQRMVTDHSKANDELKQLATQKSWTLPTELNAKDKAT